MLCLESAFRSDWSDDPPDPHGLRNALDALFAQVLVVEVTGFEIMGARCHHYRIRRRQPLKTGGEIGCLSHHGTFLGCTLADEVPDDDGTGCNADSHREIDSVRHDAFRVHRSHGIEERQSGTHGPFGVILVGARVSEVSKHSIAHVAGHETVESLDGGFCSILVAAIDLAHLLGIEMLGELGGTDEIAEHHRQLAALGFAA